MNEIKARVEQLRAQMKVHGVDAYIVPTSDFHETEYVCDHFKAREYMSGFTGSAGTCVFTADAASCGPTAVISSRPQSSWKAAASN